MDRRGYETLPHRKDLRTEDSLEDILGVVMVIMVVIIVTVVRGKVVGVEVVDKCYLLKREGLMED